MAKKLFSSYQLGDMQLKNRLVMAPLTRSRAIDNIPNELMATYYGQRAAAGLIITEGTSPSPNGLGYPRIPGVFSDAQVAGWKKVTEAVHTNGGKIFLQIMHTGRVGHPLNLPENAQVLAPSAVRADDQMYTDAEGMKDLPEPIAMTVEQVEEAITEYVQAAQNAIEAGFDGVEIHGANGYLIEQFINPKTNQRTDKYGGTIEKRVKFLLEVVKRVGAAIGKNKVGVRLSPFGVNAAMPTFDKEETYETFKHIAQALSGQAVYLHIVDHSSMGAPNVPADLKQALHQRFAGTYILSGGYDQERAENDLQANKGDLVAFGRHFLANPDLVKRFQQNAELNDPNPDTFYTPGAEGYTDYPVLEEATA